MMILLHGAWHGAWCWERVVALLKQKHQSVLAPDLPGHGVKKQPPFTGITLNTYVDFVCDLVAGANQRVTLVGHSMAGVVISQVAEKMPDAIDELIYVAAFIPANNQSLVESAGQITSPGVSSEMSMDMPNNAIHLNFSPRLQPLFYNRCHQEDIELAFSSAQPQPLRPMVDRVNLSTEKFGSVKKRYIVCEHDVALTANDQRQFAQHINSEIVSLEADHSPFFSATSLLVDQLLRR